MCICMCMCLCVCVCMGVRVGMCGERVCVRACACAARGESVCVRACARLREATAFNGIPSSTPKKVRFVPVRRIRSWRWK